MDRKLIWTEKASSDIEAIVRYIARRDPSAAARIGLGIYDRVKFSFIIQKREQFWTSCATAAGANSFSVVGKSSTQSEMTTSSSGESGLRQWARQIWKRRFNEWPLNN